ncbi:MAG: ribonuclease P protein component [Opitutaceae bacterium]
MGVPASQRLRKQSDFRQIRSMGKRIHCGSFIFQCLRREVDTAPQNRLSVIASRRVGNAVKRNYGKRMLREIFRTNANALPTHCDVVVVLRSSFDTQSYAELEARFLKACATICKTASEAIVKGDS